MCSCKRSLMLATTYVHCLPQTVAFQDLNMWMTKVWAWGVPQSYLYCSTYNICDPFRFDNFDLVLSDQFTSLLGLLTISWNSWFEQNCTFKIFVTCGNRINEGLWTPSVMIYINIWIGCHKLPWNNTSDSSWVLATGSELGESVQYCLPE